MKDMKMRTRLIAGFAIIGLLILAMGIISYNVLASSDAETLREQIILEYAPLVKVVAGRLSMYLGYNVEYDDLVSYGIFGLIDAIDKFDMDK